MGGNTCVILGILYNNLKGKKNVDCKASTVNVICNGFWHENNTSVQG